MSPSSSSISEELARFFCPLRYEDLPQDLVYQLKTFFLDWVASSFAGLNQRPTQIMLAFAQEMKGALEATILPGKSRHLTLVAALVNGAASHVMEMDDLHKPSIFHPAAPILPAVLAAGEKEHVSGRQLILGIFAGYEIGIRAALAAGKSHYRFWHTTATCGTFGAAAGASKVLDLEPAQFVWALGSAGTQSSGLWEFLTDGAMSKQLHPGKSAMNGLLAALLARKGFTGSTHIFEGEKGFLRATSTDHDPELLTKGLGRVFHSSGNSLKYYASCGHTHSAIEATLKAWKPLQAPVAAIKYITVNLYREALDLLEDVEASTPYLAKFNLPFCVATAICHGHVDLDDFSEDKLRDPDIRRLMGLVSLHSDPELTSQYPLKWPSKVEIELVDGTTSRGYSEHSKGDPENPFSEKELIEKFGKLIGNELSDQEKDRICSTILHLEEVNDVNDIFGGG